MLPTKKYLRRLLISQDRHEVYLTVDEYNAEYIDYITRKEAELGKTFLYMTEYGPYNIGDSSEIYRLGRVILAFALQECR